MLGTAQWLRVAYWCSWQLQGSMQRGELGGDAFEGGLGGSDAWEQHDVDVMDMMRIGCPNPRCRSALIQSSQARNQGGGNTVRALRCTLGE